MRFPRIFQVTSRDNILWKLGVAREQIPLRVLVFFYDFGVFSNLDPLEKKKKAWLFPWRQPGATWHHSCEFCGINSGTSFSPVCLKKWRVGAERLYSWIQQFLYWTSRLKWYWCETQWQECLRFNKTIQFEMYRKKSGFPSQMHDGFHYCVGNFIMQCLLCSMSHPHKLRIAYFGEVKCIRIHALFFFVLFHDSFVFS